MRSRIVSIVLGAAALSATFAPPAEALFGVGDVVIDPTNLIQNVNTAVNTLNQINNQMHEARCDVHPSETWPLALGGLP